MMTVIWGGPLLRILRHFKVGKLIRIEEPSRHFTKMGTPTMGGVMIIVPVAMLTILLNAVSLIGLNIFGSSLLVPLFAMLTFGLLGAVDDWQGLYGKRKGEGMRSRTKFIVQIILAVGLALVIRYGLDAPEIYMPGIPGEISLGVWYVPIATIIIAGMSNAVNFTDGLDGSGRLDFCNCFRSLWWPGFVAGANIPGPVLFYYGWSFVWLPLVQCSPGRIDHGGYRFTFTGSISGCRCP